MIFAATGHRPDKLGGYSEAVNAKLRKLARGYLEEARPAKTISGMALGWDMAWAEASVDLGIPFIAAIPFAGQEGQWPEASKVRYWNLTLRACDIVTVCDGGYAAWKMQERNEWMVRNCTRLVALWDGSSGGTANCVRFAKSEGRAIHNLWAEYERTR